MHFKLSTPRNLGHELTAIFEKSFDAAKRTLESSDLAVEKQVHEARKILKRLRALVRAVEGRMSTTQAERLNAALRDTAHMLSALREAEAAIAAFPRLAKSQELDPEIAQKVCEHLEKLRLSAYAANDPALAVAAALEALGPVRDVIDEVELEACNWHDLSEGITRTFKKARKLLATAKASGHSEDAHALRKLVKYHWHHLELISSAWPALFDLQIELTHELADLLGDDHDLADLERTLAAGGMTLEPSEAERVREAIQREMKSLKLRAFSLAERLFAESPRAWKKRQQAYFESWLAEA